MHKVTVHPACINRVRTWQMKTRNTDFSEVFLSQQGRETLKYFMHSVKSCRLATDVSEAWFSLNFSVVWLARKLHQVAAIVGRKGYGTGNAFILKAELNFWTPCCHSLRTPLNATQSPFVTLIVDLHGFGGWINHRLNSGPYNKQRSRSQWFIQPLTAWKLQRKEVDVFSEASQLWILVIKIKYLILKIFIKIKKFIKIKYLILKIN